MKRFLPGYPLLFWLLSVGAACAQEHSLRVAPQPVQRAVEQQKKAVAGRVKRDVAGQADKLRNVYTGQVQQAVKNVYTSRLNLLRQAFSFNRDSVAALKFPPLVKFSGGQASLVQQLGTREGNYPAQNPVSFTRFAFMGGVQILGLPLQLHALYSTEQSNQRQPMNRIGVTFDVNAVKQNLRKRIDDRIRMLEQVTSKEDLKALERLYQCYDRNQLTIPSGEVLAQYARQVSGIDSLRALPARQVQRLQDTLRQAYAKKKSHYRQRVQQKADTVQALVASRAETKLAPAREKVGRKAGAKRRPRENRDSVAATAPDQPTAYDPDLRERLDQYLKKEKITWQDLTHWQRKRDSLRRLHPEQLLSYEELMALRAVREKDFSQGMAVLQKFDLFSGPAGLLSTVKTIGLGTNYPYFTRFTLRDVALKGVYVELEPGPFYAAYASSKNLSAVPGQLTYARHMQAGRIGIGKKEKTHLYANLVYGRDDKNSFRGDSIVAGLVDTSFYSKPRENYVLGTDFRVQLKKGFVLTGEWAHSVTAMNTYENGVAPGQLGRFLMAQTADTNNVQSGQAFAAELQTTTGRTTTLSLRGERIGAGFYSLGTPYLRNDLTGYEVRLDQQLLGRKLVLSPQYGQWRDNVSGLRLGTGTMETYGLKSRLTLPRLPYVVVQYLQNRVVSPTLKSLIISANLSAGYRYQIGNFTTQTSLVATSQRQAAVRSDSTIQARVQNVTWTQQVNLSSPLSVSLNAAYLKASGVAAAGKWFTYGATLSYVFKGGVQTSAGFLQGNNQRDGTQQNQFLETRLPLNKWGEVALRCERNELRVEDSRYNYWQRFVNLTWSTRF